MVSQFVRVRFLSFSISFDLAAVLHSEIKAGLQYFILSCLMETAQNVNRYINRNMC